MTEATPITVAYGDGIGPEIMEATLRILAEAEAKLAIEVIEVGEKVYGRGVTTGIPAEAWESLRRTKVLLKSPITTPQGGGYKSLNVTMRKTLGLFANIRPCVSYYPFVKGSPPSLNMVIVRENEEDLYTGIEHRQTHDIYQCLKLISRPGSERIIRYAFDYAVRNGRSKVTCMSKDNIMKMTDGVFHKIFDKVALEYPQIKNEHYIIDIGTARIASKPQVFDVIVTTNLYGDIISDVAAEVSGSVGLAGSSNIGLNFAMFEAIHGSAPDISGKNIANPSGLLNGAIMMLVHIGQPEAASLIHNAWLKTIEDGQHTADIFNAETSKAKLGTKEFASAVIERLGQKPKTFTPVEYKPAPKEDIASKPPIFAKEKKELIGVDVFYHWQGKNVKEFAEKLGLIDCGPMELKFIGNRGLKVWPNVDVEPFYADRWRGRYLPKKEGASITHHDIVTLLNNVQALGLDFIKIENLYTFDGVPGFTMSQGE
ncbi:MAG: NADP-dependent isocitrate dehydrogenase [Alphaproteobacteria bacterium]|nr:NADP-dependent isocitrate dehydrogenase [Alphaproteobacteria bacterium]